MSLKLKSNDLQVCKGSLKRKFQIVDSVTGEKADFGSKKTLIESFKEEKITKSKKNLS